VQDVNSFLRGWVGYFRYGNSARPFDKIDRYAITRLSLFVAKRHGRLEGAGRDDDLVRSNDPVFDLEAKAPVVCGGSDEEEPPARPSGRSLLVRPTSSRPRRPFPTPRSRQR
jgi:Group II intron, maturase-specific domain